VSIMSMPRQEGKIRYFYIIPQMVVGELNKRSFSNLDVL
jgi:hypothetical protein